MADVGGRASARGPVGQRDAAELRAAQRRAQSAPRALPPRDPDGAPGAGSGRRRAEVSGSSRGGCEPSTAFVLTRMQPLSLFAIPVQHCASAMHYSSHYFITRESWFFTEGTCSWLNSDSGVFWPLKPSLVLTWDNFPLINLWTL